MTKFNHIKNPRYTNKAYHFPSGCRMLNSSHKPMITKAKGHDKQLFSINRENLSEFKQIVTVSLRLGTRNRGPSIMFLLLLCDSHEQDIRAHICNQNLLNSKRALFIYAMTIVSLPHMASVHWMILLDKGVFNRDSKLVQSLNKPSNKILDRNNFWNNENNWNNFHVRWIFNFILKIEIQTNSKH